MPQPSLLTDVVTRRAHAHDASHYLLIPQAVAVPDDEQQVAALMRRAAGEGTPLTFRSGGTSLSGQAQSDAVLTDVRRGFRSIEVLDDGARVRVGPGATVRQVNARLARHRRRLGPDPASEAACTIGGVIANNSSGMAAGTAENSYRTLESLRFVLPSGTIVDTAHPEADRLLRAQEPDLHEGLLRLRREVCDRADLQHIIRERFSMKNTMGYGINALLDFEEPAEILAHLVVGSEGTLAFVSSAVFRTVPVPRHVATGLLTLPSLDAAMRALPGIVEEGFATVELLDARSLQVAQSLPGAPAQIADLTVRSHAALLVEQRADDDATLAEATARAEHLAGTLDLAAPFTMTQDAAGRAALWTTRKGLYAAVAGHRPSGSTALLEDVVVPVTALADTCLGLQNLFERHGYDESVIFGHAKDGNIHFLVNEHLGGGSSPLEAFTEDMVDLVLTHGGNLKAEHGTGRVMAPFVERQYGPELYQVMRRIKALVDPTGILNPGVLLTDDPHAHMRHLKPVVEVEEEVDRCVECGYCEPVCPSRDLTLTPRQRIVLRREAELARRRGDTATVQAIDSAYPYQGLHTCAVDGMCLTACPVGINTADLVRRLRAEEASGPARTLWKAAAGQWGPITRGAAVALGAAGAVPAALPRAATGLARRLLPTELVPSYRPELPSRGGAARRGGLRGAVDGEVLAVFLPACVNSMFGAAAEGAACGSEGCGSGAGHTDAHGSHERGGRKHGGQAGGGAPAALERIAERAGVQLLVPDGADALCCATPFSSKGMREAKQRMHEQVRAVLLEATAPAAAAGEVAGGEAGDCGRLPVVVDAASCTEGMLAALEGTGIEVIDAVAFVRRFLLDRLEVRHPIGSVTVHPTCSTTHVGITADLLAIAEACAQEVVVPDAWGCCAYAGDRGMLHPELTASATRTEAAEVARRATDWYVSANRTCELGMSAATGQTYRHVLELLDAATA